VPRKCWVLKADLCCDHFNFWTHVHQLSKLPSCIPHEPCLANDPPSSLAATSPDSQIQPLLANTSTCLNNSPLIVDVRTEDEFAAGRIPGAVNIPLSEVEFAFSLPEKKFTETFGISKPGMADLIITSCKVGGRAAKMRDKLAQMGYTGVQAYQGSFAEWESRGGPVEK